MKTSVVVTTFNEGKTVGRLLDSLLVQTKKPDEIIIVDGGSTDRTVEILRHYAKANGRIRFTVEPGSIAHGRNTAVDLARYPIIAQIDAGCVAHKDWLERIIEPFKHESVDVVAGFYSMTGETNLQKAAAFFLGVMPQRFDLTKFLPSARSLAFRKKVHENIGGYCEKLDRAGEDTLFNYQVLKAGYKMVRVKEAIVDWEVPKTFSEILKKFYYYARGDAQAGIWWDANKKLASHNIKILLIFSRYLLGITLLILAIHTTPLFYFLFSGLLIYSGWAFLKVFRGTGNPRAGLWGIILQFASDLAVMAGFLSGQYGLLKRHS